MTLNEYRGDYAEFHLMHDKGTESVYFEGLTKALHDLPATRKTLRLYEELANMSQERLNSVLATFEAYGGTINDLRYAMDNPAEYIGTEYPEGLDAANLVAVGDHYYYVK
jgi:hypothetical protein